MEFRSYVRGVRRRERERVRVEMAGAYYAGALSRAKRIPPFQTFMARVMPSKPRKPTEEDRRTFRDLVETMGPDRVPVKART